MLVESIADFTTPQSANILSRTSSFLTEWNKVVETKEFKSILE